MLQNLKNQVVLITGGSEGYGKAMARTFKDAGARVVIAARNRDKLAAAQAELGSGVDAFPMDVTDPAAWEQIKAHLLDRYQRLDVLVNNAGGGIHIVDTVNQTVADIDAAIQLNLNSVIYGSRALAPIMQQQKSGTVINIASVCARECWPSWSVYAAAKAGVLNFSKGLYLELCQDQVRVTCLIPAAADTGFGKNAGIKPGGDARKLQAEDIAETALFIASLPPHVVIEDVTVWGIDQVVVPL